MSTRSRPKVYQKKIEELTVEYLFNELKAVREKRKTSPHDKSKHYDGPLSADVENKNVSSKHKIEYLKLLFNGKRLKVKTTPLLVGSKLKVDIDPEDDTKIPGSARFLTKIRSTNFDNEEELKKDIERASDENIQLWYGDDIDDDEFKILAEQQDKILTKESKLWAVLFWLAQEFELYFDNDHTLDEILQCELGDGTIGAAVQCERKYNPDVDKPEDKPKKRGGKIKLEHPLAWFTIKASKKPEDAGSLWCKVYDISKPTQSNKYPLAKMKNPKTKKMENLTIFTISEWLRYGSVFTGTLDFSACLSSKGWRQHMVFSTIRARRARPMQNDNGGELDADDAELIGMYGGEVDDGEDDEKDDEPVISNNDNQGLLDIESQLNNL